MMAKSGWRPLEWREPASWKETLAAHDLFKTAYERGEGTTAALAEIGIDHNTSVRQYMATHKPFMPYSKEFCAAIATHCKTWARGRRGDASVDVSPLVPRIQHALDCGYSRYEIGKYAGVSADTIGKMAAGRYRKTNPNTYDRIESVLEIMEKDITNMDGITALAR